MTEGPIGAPAPVPTEPPPQVEEGGRFSINEDWAATIFGLVLLVLTLAGIITGSLIGQFVPTLVTK